MICPRCFQRFQFIFAKNFEAKNVRTPKVLDMVNYNYAVKFIRITRTLEPITLRDITLQTQETQGVSEIKERK